MGQRIGYWQVVRDNPSFRRLWLAQVGSNAGDWFNDVAVLGLVLALTGSPAAASYVLIAAQVPAALVTPFAGVWVDRLDRRRVMVAADLIRAALALGFLLVRAPQHVWLIYVITAVMRAVSAFFYPAQTAALPNLVSRDELLPANGLSSATWGAMLAIGAAAGGIVSATLGRDAAFVINAASFLISAALIASIRGHFSEPGRPRRAQGVGGWAEWRESLSYAGRHAPVLAFLLVKAGWGVGAGVLLLLSVMATQVFSAGDEGIGWLYAMRGVGVVVGPYLASAFVGRSHPRLLWSVAIGYVLSGVGYIGFSQAPTLALAGWLVMVAHIGSGATWVLSSTMLQQIVPDRLRGRVFALDSGLVTLAIALSTWGVGRLTPLYGPRLVGAVVASVALVSAAAWGAFLLLRGERMSHAALAEASGE